MFFFDFFFFFLFLEMEQGLIKTSIFNRKKLNMLLEELKHVQVKNTCETQFGELLKSYCFDMTPKEKEDLYFNFCKTGNNKEDERYIRENYNKYIKVSNSEERLQELINHLIKTIDNSNMSIQSVTENKLVESLNIENILDSEFRNEKLLKINGLDVEHIVSMPTRKDIFFKKNICPFCRKIHKGEDSNLLMNLDYNGQAYVICKSNLCIGEYFEKKISTDYTKNIINVVNFGVIYYGDVKNSTRNNNVLDRYLKNKYFINEDNDFNKLIIYSLKASDDITSMHVMKFACFYITQNYIRISEKGWYKFENHKWIYFDINPFVRNEIKSLYFQLKEYITNDINIIEEDKTILITLVDDVLYKVFPNEKEVKIMLNNIEMNTTNNEIKKEEFDKNKNLLCFKNGVYDLKTKEFRDGKKEDMILFQLSYDLPTDYKNEEMLQNFLESIIPDKKIRKYFIRYIGNFIYSETNIDSFLLLTGNVESKENILKLLKIIFEDYFDYIPTGFLTNLENVTSDKRILVCNKYNLNSIFRRKIILNKNYGLILTNDKIIFDKPYDDLIRVVHLSECEVSETCENKTKNIKTNKCKMNFSKTCFNKMNNYKINNCKVDKYELVNNDEIVNSDEIINDEEIINNNQLINKIDNDKIDINIIKYDLMLYILKCHKLTELNVPENLNYDRTFRINNNIYLTFLDECTEIDDNNISLSLLYNTYIKWCSINHFSDHMINEKKFREEIQKIKGLDIRPSINTESGKIKGLVRTGLNMRYKNIMQQG